MSAVSPYDTHPTITFRTLGCKLNQCETAQMEEQARAAGYVVVPWESAADIRVINSCTVTAKSDRECRHEVRRAKRRDPKSFLVLTGCFAHVSPDKAAAVEGVDLVLGNPDKLLLIEHLQRARSSRSQTEAPRVIVSAFPASPELESTRIHRFSSYTRAFIEVQTGCNARCSYCVVPYARGPSRCMRLRDVVEQVEMLAYEGFKEVVLTGIHLGRWGLDTGEGELADLVRALTEIPEGPRIRLSSIEPMEWTDKLISAIDRAGPRVAHHFHVPLQSGSDKILSLMGRPYRRMQYLERVEKLAQTFPDAAIGADVIVGFPTEDEGDFNETLRLVEQSPLTYLHVFSFSDRPGTPASKLSGKVPPEVKAERSRILRELGRAKRHCFEERFLNKTVEALVLSEKNPDGTLQALTGNYIRVRIEGPDMLMNSYATVRLVDIGEDEVMIGIPVSEETSL